MANSLERRQVKTFGLPQCDYLGSKLFLSFAISHELEVKMPTVQADSHSDSAGTFQTLIVLDRDS